ncbi:MAG TPA: hypothetical protein VLH61_08315 [Bacteroidales bacterium]|nr:hypothetical protein [Bacteroidales bacterium]
MIRASVIILLLSWSLPLSAQTSLFSNDRGLWQGGWSPRFGFEIGTSFMTGAGAGSLFSQSIAPQFRFNPNQRLSFVVGSVFTSGQLSGNFGTPFLGMGATQGNFIASPQNMFSATFYAAGTYRVNERLSISGAGWVERNNMHKFQPQMNPQAFNLNPRGVMVGFDYLISPNFSFGAQINVNQGYNPFNPFLMPQGFHGGFFPRSPFHPGINW